MPIFNYKTKEIIVKIVYYGPGLCGKTTSLQFLHQQTIPERKGELYYLATETDQTIYFELVPLYVGEIRNFKLRFQVYTVPGQVKYNNTRKAVLQGVDAIVFVADSQRSRQQANLRSLENLKYNLKGGYNILLEQIPLVYEYNKRDMSDLLTVDELTQDLNPRNLPYFETIALKGDGVLDAFETISSLAIGAVEQRLSHLDGKETPTTVRNVQERLSQVLQITPQSAAAQPSQANSIESELIEDSLASLTMLSDEEEETIASATGLIVEDLEDADQTVATPPYEEERTLSYADIFAVTYQDGEIIFNEGDAGDEMYFIEEGRVRIVGAYKLTKKVLAIYEKGDFFGEMALLGGRTRSATAVAIGTTQVLPVTKTTLATQIQNRPEIALALLKTLSNRIWNDTQTIGRLADQNKELRRKLIEAHDAMKQIVDQNKLLRQRLGIK